MGTRDSGGITKRDFKYFNLSAFLSDIRQSDIKDCLGVNNVEQALDIFRKYFNKIVDKHAPFKHYRVADRNNANNCTTVNTGMLYRDPEKFWNTCNNKSLFPFPHLVIADGCSISDPEEISLVLNKHFIYASRLFDRTYEGLPPPTIQPDTQEIPSARFTIKPFSESQVYSALLAEKHKSSLGADGLDPRFLKVAATYLVPHITHIFNLSVHTGTFPRVWKTAYVTPLHKGGDTSDLNNYRPISKLPYLAKLLESLVKEQLLAFLSANSILSPNQSGFRKKHSPITAATLVLNDIITALDRGQHCAALFIDISKAFDTVDHSVLLEKLKCLGFDGNAYRWFRSYLMDRMQCVSVRNVKSDFLPVVNGVPQGSILGPILFTIYMNNIVSSVTGCNIHLYADDIIAYCSADDARSAVASLQRCFDELQVSFYERKLVLNEGKTKYMLFTTAKRTDSDELVISTNRGTVIERVTSYKYLGNCLDENLTFTHHLTELASKLSKMVNFFEENKSCFPLHDRKRLVERSFLPTLDFANIIYMHASPEALNQLDVPYHAILRFITNSVDIHPCELYTKVGWPSLPLRRERSLVLFIYKALQGFVPPYIASMLSPQPRNTNVIYLQTQTASTKLGRSRFTYCAPATWNKMQENLWLKSTLSLRSFKNQISSYFLNFQP